MSAPTAYPAASFPCCFSFRRSRRSSGRRRAWRCRAPGARSGSLPLAGLLLGRLTRKRVPGEGLGGVLLRVLGRFGGTAAVLLYTVWTVFYAGFVLRAGADRFVTAVYPGSRPWR